MRIFETYGLKFALKAHYFFGNSFSYLYPLQHMEETSHMRNNLNATTRMTPRARKVDFFKPDDIAECVRLLCSAGTLDNLDSLGAHALQIHI